ncbi:MAG: MliC family protein [Pseudorhodoplanes sp.]|nr:MliC family protein [Pseudorhodoplanes sp.]
MVRFHLAMLTMVLVTASFIPASAQTNKTFLYDCDGGLQVAVYFDRDAAFIQLDGKALKLPQRLSGSGARYAKGGVSFWIKGNDAMLKRTRTGKTINCSTR